jgi:hypothetical protein
MNAQIAAIKRFLARRFGLEISGMGDRVKILGTVPDGVYHVPLGGGATIRVEIERGKMVKKGDPREAMEGATWFGRGEGLRGV